MQQAATSSYICNEQHEISANYSPVVNERLQLT